MPEDRAARIVRKLDAPSTSYEGFDRYPVNRRWPGWNRAVTHIADEMRAYAGQQSAQGRSFRVNTRGPPISGSDQSRPATYTWRPLARYWLQTSAGRPKALTCTQMVSSWADLPHRSICGWRRPRSG